MVKMETRKIFPIRITQEMKDRITQEALRLGVPKSSVIMAALDKYLPK